MGSPATVKRTVTSEDLDLIHRAAENYIALKNDYLGTPR